MLIFSYILLKIKDNDNSVFYSMLEVNTLSLMLHIRLKTNLNERTIQWRIAMPISPKPCSASIRACHRVLSPRDIMTLQRVFLYR